MAKVCLDPGHGGYDPGAVGPTGLYEKTVALEIAQQAGQLLQAAGVQVAYTRTSDSVAWPANVNQDLAVRSQIANGTGANLFCSIHLNSSESAAAHGTETYCLQAGGNAEKAAKLVQAKLVATLGLTNRGIKTANYYVLRKTSMPAILTEVCFISNPAEEALARTAAFVTKAAQAIAAGIAEYLGVALKATTSAATTTSINIYVAGKLVGAGELINGVTMVPIGAVAGALGHEVTWDSTNNLVIVKPVTVTPTKQSKVKLLINNQVVDDVTMINGHAFIPVRDLVGALGHKVVGFDGKSVSIQ